MGLSVNEWTNLCQVSFFYALERMVIKICFISAKLRKDNAYMNVEYMEFLY